MYHPPAFAEPRVEVVTGLCRSAGFGHLVVDGPDGLESTPLPFLIDDGATRVRGHLARPNPVWQCAPCEALMIVPVTDAYVSPGWYPSKAEHGRVVPTWNYEVVHLHGRLIAHDDVAWVGGLVRELTDHHESSMPAPWSVDDAPDDYVRRMARGIVGVELEIDRVVGKRKLSQNRDDADRRGVVEALRAAAPDRTVLDAMVAAMEDVATQDVATED